jgi:hypothetical protein
MFIVPEIFKAISATILKLITGMFVKKYLPSRTIKPTYTYFKKMKLSHFEEGN